MSLQNVLHLQNRTSHSSCPDLRGQGYTASFQTHSAARGPRKKIYHGHLDGKGPRKGEEAVVKVFRDKPGTEELCDLEIEKHKLARQLAQKFNKLVADNRSKVTFTLPMKSRVESLGLTSHFSRHKGRSMDRQEWVLVEENFIRLGEYQVFIRKTGDRLTSDPTSLDAFLHYSYHESQGQLVMCGFQGVHTKDGYTLTTPCIHSTTSSYGRTVDRGMDGILDAFKHHHCNNLCYDLLPKPKPRISSQPNILEGASESDEGASITDIDSDEIGIASNPADTSSPTKDPTKDIIPPRTDIHSLTGDSIPPTTDILSLTTDIPSDNTDIPCHTVNSPSKTIMNSSSNNTDTPSITINTSSNIKCTPPSATTNTPSNTADTPSTTTIRHFNTSDTPSTTPDSTKNRQDHLSDGKVDNSYTLHVSTRETSSVVRGRPTHHWKNEDTHSGPTSKSDDQSNSTGGVSVKHIEDSRIARTRKEEHTTGEKQSKQSECGDQKREHIHRAKKTVFTEKSVKGEKEFDKNAVLLSSKRKMEGKKMVLKCKAPIHHRSNVIAIGVLMKKRPSL